MKIDRRSFLAAALSGMSHLSTVNSKAADAVPIRIMTYDPGHFHAALLMKEMTPGVSPETYVYAPLGPDLTAHLNRVARFNARKERPTSWNLRIYAGEKPFERMLAEKPGNVVVFSGRNLGKIDRIGAAIQAGLHALADKPWLIEAHEFPKLAAILDEADKRKVIGYDAMTERFEIAYIVQKELVRDRDILGTCKGVYMESVHYLLKTVAGVVNQRPPWFFDYRQQGEGLTDVGTHLVDMVQWTLADGEMLDYRKDIRVTSGKRWPTVISKANFQRITGEPDFPPYLASDIRNGELYYYCNNSVEYTLKGIPVRLDVKWDFEPAPGQSDTRVAIYSGSLADVEFRQGKEEKYVPELYVVPKLPENRGKVAAALRKRVAAVQKDWPGVALKESGPRFHVTLPDKYRVGHEAHFALLTERFFQYLRQPAALPPWEKPFMLAKYFVTTQGVELARESEKR